MKKILLGCLVLPLALSLTSCLDDAVDTAKMTVDKKDEISKDDPDKVFSALMQGVYTKFQFAGEGAMSHNYFGQKSFDYLSSLMGNDMCMTGRFGMSLYHYLCDYGWQDYSPTSYRWAEYYNHIEQANQILAVTDENAEDKTSKKYLAFAHTLRGYAYLQLSYLYQLPYYLGADDTPWGKGKSYDNTKKLLVPIVTEKLTGNQPRATVEAVYEQMIGDLTRGYELYKSIDAVKTPVPTDLDGCVAATYLARALMVKHEWAEAQKYLKVVKDNYGILNTKEQLHQGFSDITLPDVVFGCDITSDNSTTYASYFSQMDKFSDGYGGIGVWRVAYAPLVEKIAATDTRKDWFFHPGNMVQVGEGAFAHKMFEGITKELAQAGDQNVSKYLCNAVYQSVKFKGTGLSNLLGGKVAGWELGDYIYLRSEEAYLMDIECKAHLGDINGAKLALEEFMKTRQPDYKCAATTKSDLIAEINFQKRVEFWGEGIEFLDNRRLNIPVDRTKPSEMVNGKEVKNNHFSGALIKFTQEDRAMTYQLPVKEIENNTEIGPEDQN